MVAFVILQLYKRQMKVQDDERKTKIPNLQVHNQ